MKICVTTFYSKYYQPLADITLPPLMEWCGKHGYDTYYGVIADGSKHHFVKTKYARELLEEYDVVMAIENDILITNLNYRIHDFIDYQHDFFICKDVNNYNGGCFIVKATKAGRGWMDFVNSFEWKYGDEQNVFEEFCADSHIVKTLQHPAMNSIPYEYYAPSYGYINWEQYNPRKEKPTHEMGCWQKGDFCCHLPGMTLEKRIEIFNKIKEEIVYG